MKQILDLLPWGPYFTDEIHRNRAHIRSSALHPLRITGRREFLQTKKVGLPSVFSTPSALFPPPRSITLSSSPGSWNICSWFLPIIINLNNIHSARTETKLSVCEERPSWEIILINLLRCTFLAAAMPTPPAAVSLLRFFNSVVETLCYFIKSYENWQLTPRLFLVPNSRINFKHCSERLLVGLLIAIAVMRRV